MPVLAASTPMSPTTARIWAPTIRAGTSDTSLTPWVFWTVIDVIALVPHTPSMAKVFRSAWIPAPPPESDPAMVSTMGTSRAPDGSGKVIPSSWFERMFFAI